MSKRLQVAALILFVALGFMLRLRGLDRVGFNEDEVHKVEAARAYLHGSFSVNLEHPMLMKSMIAVSVAAADLWNRELRRVHQVTEEGAVRLPNVIFGSLTAVVLFLVAQELFSVEIGLLTAFLWSIGTLAIMDNRLAKEDTLLVFFTWLGYYRLLQRILRGRVNLDEVETELRAQISKVVRAGISPTHLDGHKHVHVLPGVANIVTRLAWEFAIPSVRCPVEEPPGFLNTVRARKSGGASILKQYFVGRGVSVFARRFQQKLAEAGLHYPGYFYGLSTTGFLNTESIRDLLGRLPEGTSELMCHPGYADASLAKTGTRLLAEREVEAFALCSPLVKRLVVRNSISQLPGAPGAAAVRGGSRWKYERVLASRFKAGRAGTSRRFFNMHSQNSIRFSMVVPLYDEAANLTPLYVRLTQVMSTLDGRYEIIFVDDGSRDGTAQLLDEIYQSDSRVKVITLRRNFGQTAALKAGFDAARGDIVISMDGDLQHEPEQIPAFISKLEEGYDIVSGWREQRQDTWLTRRLPSRIANWAMSKLARVPLHDFGATFKAYRREIIQSIQLYGDLHRFIPALAAGIGARIAEIPISNPPRANGKSNYGISRTFRVVLDLLSTKFLLDYSSRPMHFLGFFALLMTGSGTLMGSVVIVKKLLFQQSVMLQNGPLLFGATLFTLAGLQLLGLGLVSEILSRTYYESQKKPIYATRQIQSHEPELARVTKAVSHRLCRTPGSMPRSGYVVESSGSDGVVSLDGAA